MFSVETFQTIKRLLTFSLAKPRENAEVMLKQYELCIYGDMHKVTTFIFLKCAKNSYTPAWDVNCTFIHFCYFQYIPSDNGVEKIT